MSLDRASAEPVLTGRVQRGQRRDPVSRQCSSGDQRRRQSDPALVLVPPPLDAMTGRGVTVDWAEPMTPRNPAHFAHPSLPPQADQKEKSISV